MTWKWTIARQEVRRQQTEQEMVMFVSSKGALDLAGFPVLGVDALVVGGRNPLECDGVSSVAGLAQQFSTSNQHSVFNRS